MTDTVPYEFDLDTDRAAREAVRFYCDLVEPDNPALAKRLRKLVAECEEIDAREQGAAECRIARALEPARTRSRKTTRTGGVE